MRTLRIYSLSMTFIFKYSNFFKFIFYWNIVTQQVKNPLAMQETQEMRVQFLGWEDPLEEAMATHSSILAWKIPLTKESGGL